MGGADGGKAIGRLTPKMAQRPRASDAVRRFVAGDGRARKAEAPRQPSLRRGAAAVAARVAYFLRTARHAISQHRAHSCPQESLYLSACPA